MFGKDKKEEFHEKILYEAQPNIFVYSKGILISMFVLGFLFFLFYWYFISAFCAVYQNTQVIFLRDSGISILTSFLDPFIIYGITALLRIISLCLCFKKYLLNSS